MFFFNGRIRNAHIVPMITRDRPYTHKVGQSVIIVACLSIVIGLICIIIGVISETEKSTFFAIGTLGLCGGFFLTTFVCFYARLITWYHNWTYGSHITPSMMETSVTATAGDISLAYHGRGSTIVRKSLLLKPPKTIPTVEVNKTTATLPIEH